MDETDQPDSSSVAGDRLLGWPLDLLVGTAAFLLYLATAAQGPWWGDGVELTLAAWSLGVPHPTGYPLYMMLGHGFIRLLGGTDPHFAMTVFSAALLAGSAGLICAIARRSGLRAGGSPSPAAALGGAFALLVAVGRTVWEHATFPEVYPLTLLIAVLIIMVAATPAGAASPRRVFTMALLAGLGALNHYSIAALYPLAGLWLLAAIVHAPRRGRIAAIAVAGVLLGLAGLLYLPLRAAADPLFNWGDPSSARRFIEHVRGHMYRDLMKIDLSLLPMLASRWLAWWGRLWLPAAVESTGMAIAAGLLPLGGAVGGLVALTRRERLLGAGLLGSIGVTFLFSIAYTIGDIDPYFLPALPAAAIGWLHCALPLRRRAAAAAAGAALLACGAVAWNYRIIDKSGDIFAFSYGARLLEHLPPRALLITESDAPPSMVWYEQHVNGKRTDVVVVPLGIIMSDWVPKMIERLGAPPGFYRFDDPHPKSINDFQAEIVGNLILPAMADGRRVFTSDLEFPYGRIFPTEVAVAMYPPADKDADPYDAPLKPPPFVWELKRNPRLEGLDIVAMRKVLLEAWRSRDDAAWRYLP